MNTATILKHKLFDNATDVTHQFKQDQSWNDFREECSKSDGPVFMSDRAYLALYQEPDIDGYLRDITYNFGARAVSEAFLSYRCMTGPKPGKKLFTDDNKEDMSMDKKEVDYQRESLNRSKKIFRRLLLHNYSDDTFLMTLTYAKGCHDRDEHWHFLHEMVIRFKTVFGFALNYIAIPELHPGGHGYHWHLVINNPYFDYDKFRLQVWRQGFCRASPRPKGLTSALASNLAGYLVKYIGKDMDSAPFAKKRYSRGGVWKTDWQVKDEVTIDAHRAFRKMIAYLASQGVPFLATTFEPFGGQMVHRVIWDSGQYPDLDLSRCYRKPPSSRTYVPHPRKGKDSDYTQEIFQYEV